MGLGGLIANQEGGGGQGEGKAGLRCGPAWNLQCPVTKSPLAASVFHIIM